LFKNKVVGAGRLQLGSLHRLHQHAARSSQVNR
jgi:hypothetical protein